MLLLCARRRLEQILVSGLASSEPQCDLIHRRSHFFHVLSAGQHQTAAPTLVLAQHSHRELLVLTGGRSAGALTSSLQRSNEASQLRHEELSSEQRCQQQ